MARFRDLLPLLAAGESRLEKALHAVYLSAWAAGGGAAALVGAFGISERAAAQVAYVALPVLIAIFAALLHAQKVIGRVIYDFHARPLPKYTVDLTPEPPDLGAGIRILQEYFGDELIPEPTFYAIQSINSRSYIIVKDVSGEVVGIGDFHGLKPQYLEKFISGEVGEPDFRPSWFLSEDDLGEFRQVYIGGISVKRGVGRIKEAEIAQAATVGLSQSLYALFSKSSRRSASVTAFSLGCTKIGTSSLKRYGFSLLREATNARAYPIYHRVFSLDELRGFRRRGPAIPIDVDVRR